MTFQIEDNVKVPSNKSGRGRAPKYPIHQLEIGQSFAIPNSQDVERDLTRLRGAVNNFRRNHHPERRFKVAVDDNGEPRVWRVEDREPGQNSSEGKLRQAKSGGSGESGGSNKSSGSTEAA